MINLSAEVDKRINSRISTTENVLEAHNSQLSDITTQLNNITEWKDSIQNKDRTNKSNISESRYSNTKKKTPYRRTDLPFR